MNGNIKRKILVYALGGAKKNYIPLDYGWYFADQTSISDIRYIINDTIGDNDEVKYIYLIDPIKGIKYSYNRSLRDNSIESGVIFKDLLDRKGLLIYKK